jgi:hypothetical protein
MNERSNERPVSADKENRADEKRESHATAKGAVVGGVAGGVAGGAITGALAGGLTGPVGAAIGAAAGAVVGAMAGKANEDKGYGDAGVVNDGGTIPLDTPDREHDAATGALTGGAVGGVAGGVATGAMAGGVAGPVGAAVGAAAGAGLGAAAGAARDRDDDGYWRDNWGSRPYVRNDATYDDYSPAYRYGAEAHTRYPGQHFDDIEPDLERDWQGARGTSSLEWEHARHASRDAWQRVKDGAERAMPGDSDGDGL